jgi:hypothetical protein
VWKREASTLTSLRSAIPSREQHTASLIFEPALCIERNVLQEMVRRISDLVLTPINVED